MFKTIKIKILNIVNHLFFKKDEENQIEENKKIEIIKETDNSFNKSDDFINGFINYSDVIKQDKPIKCNKSIQILFDEICAGDIVYSYMPLSKEELDNIPEGHRTRPYYIAYKLCDGFIAYSCSSSPHDNLPDTKTYCLSDLFYNLSKSSYLDLQTSYYLPKDKLIRFICETREYDYNQIQRRLWINKTKEYEDLYKEKPVLCNPIPGDIIIKKDNYFLIFDMSKSIYFVLEVDNNKTFKNEMFVHCNSTVWKVNLNNRIVINKNENIKTQNIVNADDFANLKKQLEIDLLNRRRKKKVKKEKPKYFVNYNMGTVFKDTDENEEYVYLYSNRSYDYCIKVSEYLNNKAYPEYGLYETRANELIKNGEITDDELKEILSDQINYGNDKLNILKKTLKMMDNSISSYKKGKVSKAIDLSKFED